MRRNCLPQIALATGLLCAWAPPLPAQQGVAYTGKVFIGIAGDTVPLPEDVRYESTFGIRLTRVAAGSSGEAGGLAVGDIVVSLDGNPWTSEQIRLSRSFGKAGDKARPGEVVRVRLLRADPEKPDGPRRFEAVDIELLPYPRTAPEQPHTPRNDEMRPDLASEHSDYEELCRKLIRRAGTEDACKDVFARLARCEQVPDPDRLPLVRYVHRDPFKLEPVSREIIDAWEAVPARGVADVAFALGQVRQCMTAFGKTTEQRASASSARDTVEAVYTDTDLNGHLDYVKAVLQKAAELHERAFAGITAEEVAFIQEHREGMLDAFIDYKILSCDKDYARQKATLKLLDMACKIDIEALVAQAEVVSLLVEPAFTASLKAAAEASGKSLDAPVVLQKATAFGRIVVGGRGRRRYQGAGTAVIYELGGDDVYADNQATSVWGSIPSAVIVDYAGDDAYETYEPFRQGCGDFGVGLLVDLAGDDTYIGTRFTQGAGFMGIGMLVDEAGDDVYRGMHMHQGVAHWGAGLLLDRAGNDRYEAHMASQGVGIPGGLGLLYDGGGNDSYYCKGSQATGYGTAGVFEGWGQGMGFGYRPYASGGIGLLLDVGGTDRMEAGNFSQGGGYYYGFGLLYAGGAEDDSYIGSRYAQGFACHQAAGAMIETGGNDHYATRNAVAQGLAWDEAVALFREESGDDVYEGGGFSHGASANNGWVLFLDLQGRDTYRYTDQARAGGNNYHGGTSLSFFLDAGGAEDEYPKRPNNRIVTGTEHSLFIDLPTDVAGALTDAALDQLMETPDQ